MRCLICEEELQIGDRDGVCFSCRERYCSSASEIAELRQALAPLAEISVSCTAPDDSLIPAVLLVRNVRRAKTMLEGNGNAD